MTKPPRRTLSLQSNAPLKTGKRLDIYIDSCNMQPSMLHAIDTMITKAMQSQPRIYADYRIVVPAMINIEANRVLFPEFQKSALIKEPHGEKDRQAQKITDDAIINHDFFEKHAAHLVTPETPEAAAWRTLYTKQVPRILNYQSDYPEGLTQTANAIATQCGLQIAPITLADVTQLMTYIGTINAPRMREDMNYAARRDGISRLSTATQKFFGDLSTKDRCILQASYRMGGFRRGAHNNKIFSHIVQDAGEHAIVGALNTLPDAEADKTTSIIVSDDIAARRLLRGAAVPPEKAPIVVTGSDFLNGVATSFAPLKPQPAGQEEWRVRISARTTESDARLDYSSAEALSLAMRTGTIDMSKIRAVDNSGHAGPGS